MQCFCSSDSKRPARLIIDLAALRHNTRLIKSHLKPQTQLLAVVKANAYGHGALPCTLALLKSGVDQLGVATVEEGLFLRKNGITAPILILGLCGGEEIAEALVNDIQLTIIDAESARRISACAQKLNKVAQVHIKADTGMARLGICSNPPDIQTLKTISELPNLDIVGIFSHFAAADDPEQTYSKMQLQRFLNFIEAAKQQGLNPPLRHICNGSAIIDFPAAHLDMVRTGMPLYGGWSAEHLCSKVPLKPVMQVSAQISQIRTIAAGESVGYSCTWKAPVESRIATLPLGYADGLPRLLANRAEVLVNGQRAKLVGSICMDQVMVDVTHIPEAKAGDTVVLVGAQGDECITLEELAAHAQTINYEICTRLGQRLPCFFAGEDAEQDVQLYTKIVKAPTI